MKPVSLAVIQVVIVAGVAVIWVQQAWADLGIPMLGFGLAIAWAVAFLRGKFHARTSPALVLLVAIAVWAAIQMAAGISVYRWKTEVKLIYWMANAAYFWVALQVFTEHKLRHRLVTFLVIFGAVLAAVSTVQFYTSNGLIFWVFRSMIQDAGQLPGPFLNRNHFATLMELLIPMAMYRAMLDRRFGALYTIAAGAMYASVIATASRAGGILATAEIIAVPLLLWRKRVITGVAVLPAVGALALTMGGLVMAAGYEELTQRVFAPDQYAGRREFLESSLAMAKDHPLTGTGLGTWAIVYPRYAIFDDGKFANQAHNDWAQWLAEGGLPMLLLILAIGVWVAPRAVRSVWGIGALALLMHSWVDYPLERTAMAMVFFVILGALANADEWDVRSTRHAG